MPSYRNWNRFFPRFNDLWVATRQLVATFRRHPGRNTHQPFAILPNVVEELDPFDQILQIHQIPNPAGPPILVEPIPFPSFHVLSLQEAAHRALYHGGTVLLPPGILSLLPFLLRLPDDGQTVGLLRSTPKILLRPSTKVTVKVEHFANDFASCVKHC